MVGSLELASLAAVHAASLSAVAFKSGDKLSSCATPTAIIPLRKIKTTKVTDFMGLRCVLIYRAIKGRYHIPQRQTVVQAGPGRRCTEELAFPAAIAHPAGPPRLQSAENLYWKARAKPAISFCRDPVLGRPASPALLHKPFHEGKFHPALDALPAPASIHSPHSN